MTPSIWDRETLLDITVNVIPLGILAFFTVAFVVVDQFGWDSLYTPLQLALVVLPFLGLVVLTYFSARAIETDAKRRDHEAIPGYSPGAKTTPGIEGETAEEADGEIEPAEKGTDEAGGDEDGTVEGDTDETDDEADAEPDDEADTEIDDEADAEIDDEADAEIDDEADAEPDDEADTQPDDEKSS